MMVSKDFVEAVMMLSFIILVLVGTTEFDSDSTKNIVMGCLGVVALVAIATRVYQTRHPEQHPAE